MSTAIPATSHADSMDLDDCQSQAMCKFCSVLAVATCLILMTIGLYEIFQRQGYLFMSGLQAIHLVALASTSFVVAGVGFSHWSPTAKLGQKLIQRVTHTRTHWETDTLRSFAEVGIWLGVIWGTFQQSGGGMRGIILSLICSTIAGCLLAIMGDLLQDPLRKLFNGRYQIHNASAASTEIVKITSSDGDLGITCGTLMLMGFYGHGAIQTIYSQCHDVGFACLLAATAGAMIVTIAKVIQLWRPMRHAGFTMQMRITDTFENWQKYPVRSAMESTFWVGCLIGTYAYVGNFCFALQVSTFAGIAICLSSELFLNRFLDSKEAKASEVLSEKPAVAPACLFAYGMLALLMLIFSQAHHWMIAIMLSTIAGFLFSAVGQLCLRWTPTARAGAVLNSRVLKTAENWADYPLRSFVEVSTWLGATWACFATTHSVFVATGAGALTGVVVVLGHNDLGWGSVHVQDLTREQPPNDNVKTSVHEEDNPVCEMVSAQCEQIKELAQHSQSAVRYPTGSKSKVVSWDEVVKHSTQDDAWLVIHDKVYDVTDWAPSHPGGSIIYKFAGVDASDQFDAFHLPRVEKRLPRFLIGSLRSGDQKAAGDKGSYPSSPSGATLEYRALRERLRKEGYFEPRMSFYLGKACICAILFISSILIVLLAPERFFWLRTVGAGCLLGLGLQQVAFLGHDVAHHGVCSPTNGGGFNWFAWFLTGPCFGISGEMWNEEHSMHHAITLRPQEDPQFNYLPLWLISMKELDVPGTRIDFFTRFLISVQHLTFLPLAVCIGRINFHGLAFAFCLKRSLFGSSAREQLRGLMDVGGIIIYGLWFVSVVLLLEGWQARTLFFVAAYWMAGILHIQLLVSHLFCETFTAEEEREEQFFSFQLKTTRNIDAAWYDHWFHGGLEYQIEHHLFPQLPRHNLEKVQPFVQDICQRHGIPYNSASMSETLMHIMKDFRRLAFAILTVEIG